MADPFSIVGLTASIVSLIEFGIKLVSASRSLYDSPVDTADELYQLGRIVEDVRRKNVQLKKIQTTLTRKLDEDEIVAIDLAVESDKIAADLKKVLNKLKIRDDRSKKIEVLRVVISQRLKRKEVDVQRVEISVPIRHRKRQCT